MYHQFHDYLYDDRNKNLSRSDEKNKNIPEIETKRVHRQAMSEMTLKQVVLVAGTLKSEQTDMSLSDNDRAESRCQGGPCPAENKDEAQHIIILLTPLSRVKSVVRCERRFRTRI